MRMSWSSCCWVLLAAPLAAAPRAYVVDPAASAVSVRVGKAGLFKFAGHEHTVLAPRFTGEVLADAEDLARSSVSLTFETAALGVSPKGEPPEDVPKVQARMLGPDQLDAAKHPSVAFRSSKVEGKAAAGGWELKLTGELTIRGVSKAVTIPVHVELSETELTASGRFEIKHTDFGIEPVSVAGVVKVKNELLLEYKLVARRAPEPTAPAR